MGFGTRLHESIFNKEIKTVKVAGMDVPVKFGISALEEVQEKYGTLIRYEQKLKGIMPKDEAVRDALDMLAGSDYASEPVTDGIIAMIHCGCWAKDYDLVGVTDGEIISALEMPYPELRTLVIEEFNKNFTEVDEQQKKQTRAKKSSR